MVTSSPIARSTAVVTNPNVMGRRTYGGPRVLVNPKILPAKSNGSVNSLNSSGSSIGLDSTTKTAGNGQTRIIPPSPVVRPPSNSQDRPSFYKGSSNTEIW